MENDVAFDVLGVRLLSLVAEMFKASGGAHTIRQFRLKHGLEFSEVPTGGPGAALNRYAMH